VNHVIVHGVGDSDTAVGGVGDALRLAILAREGEVALFADRIAVEIQLQASRSIARTIFG
jgi:hypothetical protein